MNSMYVTTWHSHVFTFKMFQHIYNCPKTLKYCSILFVFHLTYIFSSNTDVRCSTRSVNHVLLLFIRIDFWVEVSTATIVNIVPRAPPPFLLLSCLFLCCSSPRKWQAPLTEKTVTMKRYHRFNNVCTKGEYLPFI